MDNIRAFDPLEKLNRDLKKATADLTDKEARYLVDSYYQIQEYRKRAANQVKATEESEEPNQFVQWQFENMQRLENNIKSALDYYTSADPVGSWAKSICGIGPVISAGLLAHIDITKAPTAGAIWNYAGLAPGVEWNKGEKRPWNARLKTLCWKIGESFVKVSNNDKDFYGHLYRERKEYEQKKNDVGEYKEQAEQKLKKFKIGKDTDAYKYYSEGKLPLAHINERAKRWAVKLFLAHYHEVAYELHYGEAPPNPYPIAILGHAHKIERPV